MGNGLVARTFLLIGPLLPSSLAQAWCLSLTDHIVGLQAGVSLQREVRGGANPALDRNTSLQDNSKLKFEFADID